MIVSYNYQKAKFCYAFFKKAKELYYRLLQIELQQAALDGFEKPTIIL